MEDTQMTKKSVNPNTWIILICTILIVVFMSFALYYMAKHVSALRDSPFTYGAQKTSESNDGADVSCACTVAGNNQLQSKMFFFNSTSIWQESKRWELPNVSQP